MVTHQKPLALSTAQYAISEGRIFFAYIGPIRHGEDWVLGIGMLKALPERIDMILERRCAEEIGNECIYHRINPVNESTLRQAVHALGMLELLPLEPDTDHFGYAILAAEKNWSSISKPWIGTYQQLAQEAEAKYNLDQFARYCLEQY